MIDDLVALRILCVLGDAADLKAASLETWRQEAGVTILAMCNLRALYALLCERTEVLFVLSFHALTGPY